MNIRTFAFLVSAFFLISCSTQADLTDPTIPDPNPDPGVETQGTQEDYINSSITYALSMFADVNACRDENVLISPYSLQTALYMTMNGTANSTLEEFQTALNVEQFLPSDLNAYHEDIAAALSEQLQTRRFL